ncbi:hypothetical protein KCU73_g4639, partial [Aureobasidium melanogenum]
MMVKVEAAVKRFLQGGDAGQETSEDFCRLLMLHGLLETGPQTFAAIDADAGLGHTGGPADSGAAANIFEYLAECPEDVTNAMLISTLWRTGGDKVLHMTYSTKAATKPLRAHPSPLKKLVFSLDNKAFHEPNSVWFEPEHVEVVFFDDLFVSNYISGDIRLEACPWVG